MRISHIGIYYKIMRINYRKITLASSALFLAAFFSYVYYPGYVYWDAYEQYREALAGRYGDWHPPVIAFLWRYIILITGEPAALYIALTAIVYAAFYILLRPFKLYISLPLLLVLSVFPLFGAWFGLVWKDSFLADLVLLTAAIFAQFAIEERPLTRSEKIICAVLLALATLSRANAPFLTAPLFIYMFAKWKFNLKTAVYSICLTLALILGSGVVNHQILKARNNHAIRSLQIFNLAGVSAHLHKNFIPGKWTEDEDKRLIGCYRDMWWDPYATWNTDKPDLCSFVWSKLNKHKLSKIWLQTIIAHPIAYTEHRLGHFNSLMKFWGHDKPDMPMFPIKPGYQNQPNAAVYHVYDAYAAFMNKFPHQIWFYGFFWLAVAIGFLIATLPETGPAGRLVNCLSVSTLFYYGAYLIVSVASQFRYLLPGCYLMIAALILASYGIYRRGGVGNLTGHQKAGIVTALSIIALGVIL